MSQKKEKRHDFVEDALAIIKEDVKDRGCIQIDELSKRRTASVIIDNYSKKKALKKKMKVIYACSSLAAVLLLFLTLVFFPSKQAKDSDVEKNNTFKVLDSLADAKEKLLLEKKHKSSFIPGSKFEMLMGNVQVEHGHASLGMEVPVSSKIETENGQAAFVLPTQIAVGIGPDTSIRPLWSGNNQYGVLIKRGVVLFSIDPEQKRDGFFVDTPAGTIKATGTLFTVIVTDEKDVYVHLYQGAVQWEKTEGEILQIPAGKLVKTDFEKGLQIISPSALPQLYTKAEVQVQAFRCMDQHSVFSELGSILCLGKIDHGRSYIEKSQKMDSVNYEKNASSTNVLKKIMAQARQFKTQKDWQKAALAYKKIIDQYPETRDAHTSLVSLGQIQLQHLNQPKQSLKTFSSYLQQPGPLTQEALYGIALAHRDMKNIEGEKKSLQRLHNMFPNGLYASSVQNRLEQLE